MRPKSSSTLFNVALAFLMISSALVLGNSVPALAYLNESGLSENGNQELLADPTRPIIYFTDPQGSGLWIWDGVSDPMNEAIIVGERPVCVDLSSDGAELFVSIAGENRIAIVDIESRSVVGNISLTFSPLSVRDGREDRLYVSSSNTSLLTIINRTSGAVIATEDLGEISVLEVSPDGDTLISASLYSSIISVKRYNISTDTLTLEASGSSDLYGPSRQILVDWIRGKVFVAEVYGIHVLNAMSLERTYYISGFNDLRGIALSNDGMYLASVNSELGGGIYKLHDAATNMNLNGEFFPVLAGPLAFWHDDSKLYAGAPFPSAIEPYASLQPAQPSRTEVYGYTPAYVELTIDYNLINPPLDADVQISVDGIPCEVYFGPEGFTNYYRGRITTSLADGSHDVNATIAWSGVVRYTNYSFTIDREQVGALRPSVFTTQPLDGFSSQPPAPSEVQVWLYYPTPEPMGMGMNISMNGLPLDTHQDAVETNRFYASLQGRQSGAFDMVANLEYDGTSPPYEWSFTYRTGAFLTPVFPGDAQELTESPDHFEVQVYPGDPAQDIHPTEIYATLDGYEVQASLTAPLTVGGDIAQDLGLGEHFIYVRVGLDDETVERAWSFQIAAPPEPLPLTTYSDPDGFDIPYPIGWTASPDQDVGGEEADLLIQGPTYGAVATNVLVDMGYDASLRETQSYLDDLVDQVLEDINEQGYSVNMLGAVEYTEISNHTSAVFAMKWEGYPIIQKAAIIIDEEHFRYWMIIFTVDEGTYADLEPTFDAMIEGFEVTLEPSLGKSDLITMALIGVVAIVALVVLVVLLMRRKGRK